jgi:hypothetical protein
MTFKLRYSPPQKKCGAAKVSGKYNSAENVLKELSAILKKAQRKQAEKSVSKRFPNAPLSRVAPLPMPKALKTWG